MPSVAMNGGIFSLAINDAGDRRRTSAPIADRRERRPIQIGRPQ